MNTNMVIHKLRSAITSISDATKKLYQDKNINDFLQHLSKQACKITNSEKALIIINEENNENKVFGYYSKKDKDKVYIEKVFLDIASQNTLGSYGKNLEDEYYKDIKSYIFYKIEDKNQMSGCIVCVDGENYTSDDLNILGILAKQVSVAMQLYKYNVTDTKHKILANELNILNKQQKLIMDKSKINFDNEKELYFYHKPAAVVGGDFYHAIKIDEENIVYIIADVMGHGMVSNYVVAMIKGAFKVLCKLYNTPSEIMQNLNETLYDEFDKMDVFTTCMISIVNTKKNIMSVCNAGHYSPIIIRNDKTIVEDLKCKKGIPLGILNDTKYETNTVDISDYSMICMYTDGILEIKNKSKEEYGIDNLQNFLQKNYDNTQEKLISNLKKDLKLFSSQDDYDDDILLVMLKNKAGGINA